MTLTRKVLVGIASIVAIAMALPEWPNIPVAGATSRDWNSTSYWYEPWGVSGVHKGIDIFANKGRDVIAPTYGVVIFRGQIALGGNVVLMLGPKLRVHYFAHLESIETFPGRPVRTGHVLGTVGDSGNAKGKPPHLHYAVITLLPYVWRVDASPQGWKKTFYLDPNRTLRSD